MHKVHIKKSTRFYWKKTKDNTINRYSMFMYIETQYCQNIISFQHYLMIEDNPNQNTGKLFWEYRQINSKVYIERQKIQNSQYNI